MLAALSNFFPLTVTIKRDGNTTSGIVERDAAGNKKKGAGQVANGVDDAPMQDIPCSKSELTDVEKADFGTMGQSTDSLLLKGYYPGITTGMKAVCSNGVTYNVLANDEDSERTQTKLTVNTQTR